MRSVAEMINRIVTKEPKSLRIDEALRRLSGTPPEVRILNKTLTLEEAVKNIKYGHYDTNHELSLAFLCDFFFLKPSETNFRFLKGQQKAISYYEDDVTYDGNLYHLKRRTTVTSPQGTPRGTPSAITAVTYLKPIEDSLYTSQHTLLTQWSNTKVVNGEKIYTQFYLQDTEEGEFVSNTNVWQCTIDTNNQQSLVSLTNNSSELSSQEVYAVDFEGYRDQPILY